MLKYVGLRLLQAIPVLIGISIASFLLIHLVPGNPARVELGPHAPAAAVRHLDHQLGLNRPLLSQYVSFLGGVAKLSFGESLAFHESVGELIVSRGVVTVLLLAYGLVISLMITVPLAVFAAVKHDRLADHVIRVIGMTLFVMPVFWIGLLLSLLFGLDLGLLPTGGYVEDFGGALRSLTLPALTLALGVTPLFVRSLRASVVQMLDAGFVEAGRARGLSEPRILFGHVLRNASISPVTIIGLTMGWLVSGAVVIENVFGLPGLGTWLVSSVSARDFTAIQGLVVVLAFAVVAINLLTDLVYAAIDPRVRL